MKSSATAKWRRKKFLFKKRKYKHTRNAQTTKTVDVKISTYTSVLEPFYTKTCIWQRGFPAPVTSYWIAGIPVKNWRILFKQSFTARMPLQLTHLDQGEDAIVLLNGTVHPQKQNYSRFLLDIRWLRLTFKHETLSEDALRHGTNAYLARVEHVHAERTSSDVHFGVLHLNRVYSWFTPHRIKRAHVIIGVFPFRRIPILRKPVLFTYFPKKEMPVTSN